MTCFDTGKIRVGLMIACRIQISIGNSRNFNGSKALVWLKEETLTIPHIGGLWKKTLKSKQGIVMAMSKHGQTLEFISVYLKANVILSTHRPSCWRIPSL